MSKKILYGIMRCLMLHTFLFYTMKQIFMCFLIQSSSRYKCIILIKAVYPGGHNFFVDCCLLGCDAMQSCGW
jgi:hypothetical protein